MESMLTGKNIEGTAQVARIASTMVGLRDVSLDL
jgi:hypothetical protein